VLRIDYTPKPVRDTSCGMVREWTAHLIPPPSTPWGSACWLAEHLDLVIAALDAGVGQVTDQTGLDLEIGPDTFPAYQITYLA
jgi:hypothetical protein